MKQLRVIGLSALNAIQIGFTFFIIAFFISMVLMVFIDGCDSKPAEQITTSALIAGVFGLIAFLATCPFCYMNGKKDKSYPFIKFGIADFLETLLQGL